MKFCDLDDLEKARVENSNTEFDFVALENKFISVAQMVSLIFEKSNGTGKPRKITYHELNDMERWFNYLHQTISWNKALVNQDNQYWKTIWAEDSFDILSKLQSDSMISKNHEYIEFEL